MAAEDGRLVDNFHTANPSLEDNSAFQMPYFWAPPPDNYPSMGGSATPATARGMGSAYGPPYMPTHYHAGEDWEDQPVQKEMVWQNFDFPTIYSTTLSARQGLAQDARQVLKPWERFTCPTLFNLGSICPRPLGLPICQPFKMPAPPPSNTRANGNSSKRSAPNASLEISAYPAPPASSSHRDGWMREAKRAVAALQPYEPEPTAPRTAPHRTPSSERQPTSSAPPHTTTTTTPTTISTTSTSSSSQGLYKPPHARPQANTPKAQTRHTQPAPQAPTAYTAAAYRGMQGGYGMGFPHAGNPMYGAAFPPQFGFMQPQVYMPGRPPMQTPQQAYPGVDWSFGAHGGARRR